VCAAGTKPKATKQVIKALIPRKKKRPVALARVRQPGTKSLRAGLNVGHTPEHPGLPFRHGSHSNQSCGTLAEEVDASTQLLLEQQRSRSGSEEHETRSRINGAVTLTDETNAAKGSNTEIINALVGVAGTLVISDRIDRAVDPAAAILQLSHTGAAITQGRRERSVIKSLMQPGSLLPFNHGESVRDPGSSMSKAKPLGTGGSGNNY